MDIGLESMQWQLPGQQPAGDFAPVLVGVVGSLSAFYHDSLDISNPEHRMISSIRLIAKMPTLVAMARDFPPGTRCGF